MSMTGRTIVAALVAATGLVGPAGAHDGHDHGGAQHGGVEAKTKRYHFEAVFTSRGLTLYAHDADHKALDVSRLAAKATFYHPNAPDRPWFSQPLRASASSPGQPPASLGLAIDLSNVPATGAKVAFDVSGLPDPAERSANFTVPFSLAKSGEIVVAKATEADQAAIRAQKLCKVSGEELGSMGGPLKVSRGDKSVLICCQGCVKSIKADPDKYLGAQAKAVAPKGDHEHHH